MSRAKRILQIMSEMTVGAACRLLDVGDHVKYHGTPYTISDIEDFGDTCTLHLTDKSGDEKVLDNLKWSALMLKEE